MRKKENNDHFSKSIIELIEEAKKEADLILSSSFIKELLEDSKIIQDKSETFLKQTLEKIIKKDSHCGEDLAKLDKMYVTKGNREKLLSRLIKKIKKMDLLGLDYEDDIARRFLLMIMQFHYCQTCDATFVTDKIIETFNCQVACELLGSLEDLIDSFDLASKLNNMGGFMKSAVPKVYMIGQYVGAIKSMKMLDNSNNQNFIRSGDLSFTGQERQTRKKETVH